MEVITETIANYWNPKKNHIMNIQFQSLHPFEKRVSLSSFIKDKYPGHVPVIIQKNPGSKLPNLPTFKFIFKDEATIGRVLSTVRSSLRLPSEVAIFLFIGNTLPPVSSNLASLYQKYPCEDGFLYITYEGEDTFG